MAEGDEVPIEGAGGGGNSGGTGGSFITRKIGPFPAWAWLIIVFVGAYVYFTMKKKNTASQTAQTEANNQGLQSESANAAADNMATESWPMPSSIPNGQVTPSPTAPAPPAYPGSPMIPSYPSPATSLNDAGTPEPSPATNMGGPNTYG